MNWEDVRTFLEAAMSIFVIVNPLGALPFIVSLSEGTSPPQRRRLVRIAGVTALAILCVMAVAGHFLVDVVFQVQISQFSLGGGLLLMVVGIRNILEAPGKQEPSAGGEDRRVMIAVSPIACPLLVGPGAIVTTMILVYQHNQFYALGACLAAFVAVILILNFSHLLFRLMGPMVTLAVGRVMNIFIVAIGVRFVTDAAVKLFPALVK